MIVEESCDKDLDSLPTTAPFVASNNDTGCKFDALIHRESVRWTVQHRLIHQLGAGGQGVVYLAEKIGASGVTVPVALKFFSPYPYLSLPDYHEDMGRVARIAAKVAVIQQDHLLDVHNFVEIENVHVMATEWIDGLDLRVLLAPKAVDALEAHVNSERWSHLNDVVITKGPSKSRLKPGIAVAIVRECLAALAALHRDGIVHGDIKPSNIMLKRTGNAKIIDLGSACEWGYVAGDRPFTPRYASPEVLETGQCTPHSDLMSLGYVLVELLSGHSVFADLKDYGDLIAAKHLLVRDLPRLVPAEVLASASLMHLVQTLVTPGLLRRIPGAEVADLLKLCATEFHHELVNGNLASEYETEIGLWLRDFCLHDARTAGREDAKASCSTA